MFEQFKIITPEISLGCNMSYDYEGMYHNTQCYTIILKDEYKEATLAYLAILNSKIMWHFVSVTGSVLRGGFFRFKTKYMQEFPIPQLDTNMVNTLTYLVQNMIDTHKQLNVAKFDSDKKFLTQRIDLLDKKIDSYVCELYGVSEEEM